MIRKSSLKLRKTSKCEQDPIVKDGMVNCIVIDTCSSINTDWLCQSWQKYYMVLLNASDGYHTLEFYLLPNNTKVTNSSTLTRNGQLSKSGLFCFLISEARQTTTLEIPDRDDTFVLKTPDRIEYIIQADSNRNMQEWLNVIQTCMALPLNEIEKAEMPIEKLVITKDEKSLTPSPEVVGNYNPFYQPASKTEKECLLTGDIIRDKKGTYYQYPWFHRSLSRSDATHLVLRDGRISGNGVFLIRQSESIPGELVLTFNCHGVAKHLRLTVTEDGRNHPIHLEGADGSHQVQLTDYVVTSERSSKQRTSSCELFPTDLLNQASAMHRKSTGSQNRLSMIPKLPEVTKFGGSVRIRTSSLENLKRQQEKRDYENKNRLSVSRALSNQYYFI